MKILFRRYHDWKFNFADWAKGEKQFKTTTVGKVRISSCYCFEATKDNIELAKKHNELLDQIALLDNERTAILRQMKNEIKN